MMQRLDDYQRKVLQSEFQKEINWSPEKIEALAAMLKVSKLKIYKWHWDQKNRQLDYFRS